MFVIIPFVIVNTTFPDVLLNVSAWVEPISSLIYSSPALKETVLRLANPVSFPIPLVALYVESIRSLKFP